jgi:DNA-binding response OmpR family regulator
VKRHILALGLDSSNQQILGKAFGDNVEVTCDDGTTPILNLVGDSPPDVILADVELFKSKKLGNRIKEDRAIAGAPLLLLVDKTEMIPDKQLIDWGVAGIIYQPPDVVELKIRVGNFLDTYNPTSKPLEINIDEFLDESRPDNLDEEIKISTRKEVMQFPPDKEEDVLSNYEQHTRELDQKLAEIKETTATEQKVAVEMKADKRQEELNEVMDKQELEATIQEIDIGETPPPSIQSSAHFSSALAGDTIEGWFRGIAEEKIDQIVAHEDFSQIIERVAQTVVPQIAEELVNKEIEQIKKTAVE